MRDRVFFGKIRINNKKVMATGVENLLVYQKAFELAMKIFEETKRFPKEEKYSLTDQVRRSSRSVCANMAEAYRKRRYPSHFISKLTDADMENTETRVWLRFSLSCKYISTEMHDELLNTSDEIGRLIDHMLHHPEKYSRNW
jgi:four helix bundle protein